MHCPACNKPMIILEFKNVEMDFCPSCEGCWLDQGELGLILTGTMDVPEDWALIGERKSKRKCPRCRGKMRAGVLAGTDVEVDVCARNQGLWLDQGKLQTICRQRGSESTASALAGFVANVFGADAKG